MPDLHSFEVKQVRAHSHYDEEGTTEEQLRWWGDFLADEAAKEAVRFYLPPQTDIDERDDLDSELRERYRAFASLLAACPLVSELGVELLGIGTKAATKKLDLPIAHDWSWRRPY